MTAYGRRIVRAGPEEAPAEERMGIASGTGFGHEKEFHWLALNLNLRWVGNRHFRAEQAFATAVAPEGMRPQFNFSRTSTLVP